MNNSDGGLSRTKSQNKQFSRNALFSWLSSLIKGITQLLMLPIMAHLLGPIAFGVYALAQPTVTFFVTLAESGIGLSLAREDESNTLIWSTAYWMLLISFTTMALLVAGSGYVLAKLSGHHELIGLMIMLSLALPLMAISIAPDARIFRRGDLRFHSIAEICSTIISAIVALSLAFNGWGIWSLAAQYLTVYFVRALILNVIAFKLPTKQFKPSALIGHINMSGALLARRSGELIARSIENALYENIFGARSLGSYTVAMQISRFGCDLFMNPPIGALYSYSLQNSTADLRDLHSKIFSAISLILIPGAILALVIAPTFFVLVLGENWSLAATIFQPLVIGYAVIAIAGLNDAILMSNNKTWRATVPALAAAAARIIAVLFGFWSSPILVAWIAGLIFVFQAIWLITATPAAVTNGWRESARSYVMGITCGLIVFLFSKAILFVDNGPMGLILSVLTGVIVWGLSAYALIGANARDYLMIWIRSKIVRS